MPEYQRNRQPALRIFLNTLIFLAICSGGAAACALAGDSDPAYVLTSLPATAEGLLFPPKEPNSSEKSQQDSANPQGESTSVSAAPDSPASTTQQVGGGEAQGGTSSAPQGCINQAGAGRPIDVNIPDDTVMEPGQDFSKTWRLVNTGGCTWTEDYQVVWFWGTEMSRDRAFSLPRPVAPGEQTEISVNLTAPLKPGIYQSSWKLRSPDGQIFGVGSGEGLYFYVRIAVAGTPAYPTASASSSQPTPTPYAGGPTRFLPHDRIDLDKNQLNPTFGEDIAMNGGKPYFLVPFEGAFLSVFGSTQPDENQCLATAPSKTPIRVDALETGTYLCFLTGDGRTGWLRAQNFWEYQNRALFNVQVYTYPLP